MARIGIFALASLVVCSTLYAGTVEDLQKIVALQQSQIQSMRNAFSSMVLMTSASKCPSGWSEYTDANGRFIVGTSVSAGAKKGQAMADQGTLQLTSVPSHFHSIDPPLVNTGAGGSHSHGTGDPNLPYFWVAARSEGPGAAKGNPGWDGNNISRSTTSEAGSHSHGVDIPAFDSGTTGTNSVDITPPYLQLRFCRMNAS